MTTRTKPASRFVNAQSWWIASELVRRNPNHLIYETHPNGGTYDVLCVAPPGVPDFNERTRIMLNRAGTIQVHYGAATEQPDARVATWSQVFSARNPHEIVKALEKLARLNPPRKAPPSTPCTLAYRLVSTLLTMTVDDRHTWDARNLFLDTSGYGDDERRRYLEAFPKAREALAASTSIDIWGEPESHVWAILRDGEPVALVSIEGQLFIDTGRIDLAEAYAANERSIRRTAVGVLAPFL